MKNSEYIFNIGNLVVDFSNALPVVDGQCMKKKQDWYNLLCLALESIGYHFHPISHPFPSIMRNWHDLDRKFLRKWLFTVLSQIATLPPHVLCKCRLGVGGFTMADGRGVSCAPVRITLKADGYSRTCYALSTELCPIIDKFIKSEALTHKIIIIN